MMMMMVMMTTSVTQSIDHKPVFIETAERIDLIFGS